MTSPPPVASPTPSPLLSAVSASDLRSTTQRAPRLGGRTRTSMEDLDGLDANGRLLVAAFCATWRHPGALSEPLDQGARIDARDDWGRTPLHLAAHENRLTELFWLLDAGADVNAKTTGPHRWTPLHGALARQAWSCVDALVTAGADLNRLESRYQRSPLIHIAGASSDIADRLPLWLQFGADPTLADDEGETPLHLAATSGTVDNLKALIQAGGVIDAPNRYGSTPLLRAVSSGRINAVRQLLAAGANPFWTSSAGVTARAMARHDQEVDILTLLDQAEQRWVNAERQALLAVTGPATSFPSFPAVDPTRKRL